MIVTTYSGKLISFSSEPSTSAAGEDGGGGALAAAAAPAKGKEKRQRGEKKIRDIRNELDVLREKVERERERVARASGNPEQPLAADVQFRMNDKWALNADEARYELSSVPPPTMQPYAQTSPDRICSLPSPHGS